MQRDRRERRRARQAGITMIETLIAAAILLLVAVMILPLFINAMRSNQKGADSSEMANFSLGSVESLLQVDIDSPLFDMAQAAAGNLEAIPATIPAIGGVGNAQLVLQRDVFRQSAKTAAGDIVHLNDGAWLPVVDFDNLEDDDVFVRKVVARQYTYADISTGVIDATSGTTLITLGDPLVFDTPMPAGTQRGLVHLREIEAEMRSRRQRGLGTQRLRRMRVY